MATVFPPPRALCPYRSRSGPAPQNLVPPQAVPALTSCSEQRKMSVQRPVQQPMVAERRGCSSASLRAAGRSGGSPHPDGAAASPSPPPPRRPPASASPPPLSRGSGPAERSRRRGLSPALGKGQGPGVGVCGAGRVGRGVLRGRGAAEGGRGIRGEWAAKRLGCSPPGVPRTRGSERERSPRGAACCGRARKVHGTWVAEAGGAEPVLQPPARVAAEGAQGC